MTIGIYPDVILAQDLSPDKGFGSDIDDACHAIHDACKGIGANKSKTMAAIATKDGTERWKLAVRYPDLYDGKSLSDLMEKEFRGDFGKAMVMLAMPLDEAEAFMLKTSFKGVGCNVDVVYSILTGRTNEELNLVKKKFFKLYTKDLGKVVASELHGEMER
jgi:Annexin